MCACVRTRARASLRVCRSIAFFVCVYMGGCALTRLCQRACTYMPFIADPTTNTSLLKRRIPNVHLYKTIPRATRCRQDFDDFDLHPCLMTVIVSTEFSLLVILCRSVAVSLTNRNHGNRPSIPTRSNGRTFRAGWKVVVRLRCRGGAESR